MRINRELNRGTVLAALFETLLEVTYRRSVLQQYLPPLCQRESLAQAVTWVDSLLLYRAAKLPLWLSLSRSSALPGRLLLRGELCKVLELSLYGIALHGAHAQTCSARLIRSLIDPRDLVPANCFFGVVVHVSQDHIYGLAFSPTLRTPYD